MRFLLSVPSLLFLLTVGGCSYYLQGVVVAGPMGGMVVLEKDDPRLTEPGLAGATLDLSLDPAQASTKELGMHQTDDGGKFRVPVKEVGAGVLIYEIDVLCRRRGYSSVHKQMPLPGSSKRLLIIMSRGVERSRRPRDVIEESLEVGRRQGVFD